MNQNEILKTGAPVIAFYDFNPLLLLELELSLRDLLGDKAQYAPLAKPSDAAAMAADDNVVLLLLDASRDLDMYAQIDAQDERIVWLSDRALTSARKTIDKRPSLFALQQVPVIATLLTTF